MYNTPIIQIKNKIRYFYITDYYNSTLLANVSINIIIHMIMTDDCYIHITYLPVR